MLVRLDSTVNGRRYRVIQDKAFRYLRIGDTDTTQSIFAPFGLLRGSYFRDAAVALCEDFPRRGSILLLGVAGATVAAQVHGICPDAKIYGVDSDATMVDIGRRYFDVNQHMESVYIGDALEWLQSCALTFDRIFVDLYKDGEQNEAIKSPTLYSEVLRHLSRGGRAYENRWTKETGNRISFVGSN